MADDDDIPEWLSRVVDPILAVIGATIVCLLGLGISVLLAVLIYVAVRGLIGLV